MHIYREGEKYLSSAKKCPNSTVRLGLILRNVQSRHLNNGKSKHEVNGNFVRPKIANIPRLQLRLYLEN